MHRLPLPSAGMSLGFSAAVAVVYTLAVARLIRVVTADVVFDPVRIAVGRRAALAGIAAAECAAADRAVDAAAHRRRQSRWNTFNYWIGCPWCVGFWIVAATVWVPIRFPYNPVAVWVGSVLAASFAASWLVAASVREDVAVEADIDGLR